MNTISFFSFSRWALGFLGLFLFFSCTPIPQMECVTSEDCEGKQRCIRNECREVKEYNEPPQAKAGPDQTVRQKSTVHLDGSESKDPDGDKITYQWSLVRKPEQSQATLSDPKDPKPTFVADAEGEFEIELTVTDSKGDRSAPDSVIITSQGASHNTPPIANAGADRKAGLGAIVELDGSHSADPDGDKITYLWSLRSQPADSQSKLSQPDSAKPTFSPDKLGKYVVELIVNDGLADSPPDSVTIEVIDDIDLVPVLDKIAPEKSYGGQDVTVTLSGKSFSHNCRVFFDGQAVPTNRVKYISDSSLEVTLDLAVAKEGKHPIKVRNPNDKESKELSFEVLAIPMPKADKLSPATATAGSKLKVTLTGSGFLPSSEAVFQAVPLPTTFVSASELSFQLDLTQTPQGSYKVSVKNPGNRTSNQLTFEVLPPGPPPVLRVLNPPSATAGTKIKFSVHGTGFSPGAVIIFNGKPIPSKRLRRDEIDADPELDLTRATKGEVQVWVKNPDGQESNKETFSIIDKEPTPHLDRILPFSLFLNDKNKLAIYGLRFVKGCQLFIGSNEIKPPDLVFRSSSFLEATVDTAKGTWKAGDVQAYVLNPANKKSNTFKLTLAHRVPRISSITPFGWNTKCDTEVVLRGSNFLPTSKVLFNTLTYSASSSNPKYKLTYVDSETLKFKYHAKDFVVSTYAKYKVYVDNGPSARSGAVEFIVHAPATHTPVMGTTRPTGGQAGTKVSITIYYSSSGRFVPGSTVYLDGKPQATNCQYTPYCSSSYRPYYCYCSRLGADLDLSTFTAGSYDLYVQNPCGKKSKSISFNVSAPPTPYITAFSPTYATVGDKKKITIKGLDFTRKHKLLWGGKEIPSTFRSDKEIITTNDMDFSGASPGGVDVQVNNSGSKGAPVKFPIVAANPALLITGVSTTVFERGKTHSNIQLQGQGFTASTEIYFNKKKVQATFNMSTQMTISSLDFTKIAAGTYYIYAKDGANESNHFPVLAKPFPPPLLDYIRPTTAVAGKRVSLSIYGKRFCKASSRCSTSDNPKILISGPPNNKDYSSTFALSYSYNYRAYGYFTTASLKPGDYKVRVQLPTGETSNAATIKLTPPPPPTLSSLSPDFVGVGVNNNITARGSNFIQGASAIIGLQTFPATSTSSSSMSLVINASNLSLGTHPIRIRNPDGQLSNSLNLRVIPNQPQITKLDWNPNGAYVGRIYTYLRVYGFLWRQPTPTFLVDGKPYTSTPKKSPRCYPSSSSPYCYLDNFSTVGLTKGKHTIQYQVQDGGKTYLSKPYTFSLTSAPAPYINYFSPYFVKKGSNTYIYIYGGNFSSGCKVTAGSTNLTPTSTSSSRVRVTIPSTLPLGTHSVVITNPDGQKSSAVSLSVVSSTSKTPAIARLYWNPGYRAYAKFTYTYLRVYGVTGTWKNATPTFLIDGKAWSPPSTPTRCYNLTSSYSYPYCYLYGFHTNNLAVGKHTIQYKATYSGQTYTSALFPFELEKPPAPTLDYFFPYYATKGSSSASLSVYGSYFTTGSTVLMGLNALPTTYSSPSRLRLTLNTTSLSTGPHRVIVRNPDNQTSNAVYLSVVSSTGTTPVISRLYWSPSGAVINRSYSYLRVYGVKGRWRKVTPTFLVDGKLWTPPAGQTMRCYNLTSSYSDPYCYLYGFNTSGMTAGKHTIQYKIVDGGKTYTSTPFPFELSATP